MASQTTMRVIGWVSVLALTVSTQQAPASPSLVNPALQYHVQTDQGDERFFRFQTESGQYRNEERHPDGSVTGSYGWVDPTGVLRLFDYVSDSAGYRIVKQQLIKVDPNSPGFQVFALDDKPERSFASAPGLKALHVGEGDLGLTRAVQVNSLVSTFDDENPDTRQTGATFFSGAPVPVPVEIPRPRVVIGARDSGAPRAAPRPRVVIGASDSDGKPAPRPQQRANFVIGAAANDE